MNVLIVDDRVPDPSFGAGFPRAYRFLLTIIKLGHKVYFHPTAKHTIPNLNIENLAKFGINVWENIEDHKDEKVDIVILSRPHNVHYHMPPIKRLFPQAKYIYDTEALWYRRYDLQLSITGKLPGWAYRYDELGLARQVDLCFVVNDQEKAILEENGVRKVVKLAHALDVHDAGLPFEERKDLLVVGGILEDDSSNEDALWHYLENCWSGVWETLQCQMDVTGTVKSSRLENNTFGHINLMGHVNELVPLYETRKVFIAATRFATGIPWKVHEAMANGIPCVISRLLANQLQIPDDVMAMVADTPQEYISKTILLYQNKNIWEDMRNNAFEYIKKDCSVEEFKNIIKTNLEELVA